MTMAGMKRRHPIVNDQRPYARAAQPAKRGCGVTLGVGVGVVAFVIFILGAALDWLTHHG